MLPQYWLAKTETGRMFEAQQLPHFGVWRASSTDVRTSYRSQNMVPLRAQQACQRRAGYVCFSFGSEADYHFAVAPRRACLWMQIKRWRIGLAESDAPGAAALILSCAVRVRVVPGSPGLIGHAGCDMAAVG